MEKIDGRKIAEEIPIIKDIQVEKEVVWVNPDKKAFVKSAKDSELAMADVEDAELRLKRFAPFIMRCFPETRDRGGIIESVLTPIPNMQGHINEKYGSELEGRLLLKQDSHLAIAGSVKARGGIYEVLKHTEDLALEHGLLSEGDSYEKLADEECRKFFQTTRCRWGPPEIWV